MSKTTFRKHSFPLKLVAILTLFLAPIAAQRLLQNQTDIGDAVKPFYGDEAGNKLAGLLRDHILISAEVIGAAKAGDTAKKDEAAQRWSGNADDIATFLSAANPKHWLADEMKKMMHDHLDLTTAEAIARLEGDWAQTSRLTKRFTNRS